MKRIDKVYHELLAQTKSGFSLYGDEFVGVTATEISLKLDLDRSNVSKDLNNLVKINKAVKTNGRPVHFFESSLYSKIFMKFNYNDEKKQGNMDVFQKIIGSDISLKDSINKAKAALFYPGNGLPILITGKTGVGKTYFVEKMYEYALKKEVISENAPFITFNCADYADNQQLLLSQLFGYKKGSFTGAESDKDGIVQAADNGFLFLDEVHRLSSKGQEMLFYLMDKGEYKRLGETNNSHKVKTRIIMATTEEPSEVLLNTFLRRIPVHIHIPSLSERSNYEKLSLICSFFLKEQKTLNRNIMISSEILNTILLSDYQGNIGEMKSTIQYICANAFMSCMSSNDDKVYILWQHLPQQMKSIGNVDKVRLTGVSQEIEFSPGFSLDAIISKYNLLEYENTMKLALENLFSISTATNNGINDYAKDILSYLRFSDNDSTTIEEMIISKEIEKICDNELSGYRRDKNYKEIIRLLAMHFSTIINNEVVCKKVTEPNNQVYFQFYNHIKKISMQIKNTFGYKISESNQIIISILTMYLFDSEKYNRVGIVIIMHGNGIAKYMAKTVNTLLSTNHVGYADLPLNLTVEQSYTNVKRQVIESDSGKGVLLLGDMGSVKGFANRIQEETKIEIKFLDLVSTPIALEATKIVLTNNLSLEELYFQLLNLIESHWKSQNVRNISANDYRYFETVVIDYLNKILTFVDAKKIYDVLAIVLEKLEKNFSFRATDQFLLKFMFHNGCMIERILLNDILDFKINTDGFNKNDFISVKEAYNVIEESFGIQVPSEELWAIIEMIQFEYPDVILIKR
ncbi:sigma 54-interacting transcriptional regulator [Enterococcus cecorum]|nr:sigma 54-interacting transcriptional regulator [Enterococcus cecorum]